MLSSTVQRLALHHEMGTKTAHTSRISLLLQFARLNQIYRERQKQLKAGVDVLKEDYRK